MIPTKTERAEHERVEYAMSQHQFIDRLERKRRRAVRLEFLRGIGVLLFWTVIIAALCAAAVAWILE